MTDVSSISTLESSEGFSLKELEGRELGSTKADRLSKALDQLDQLEETQIDPHQLSIMRQVAALGARVLDMLQKLSQNGKVSTRNLEHSIKDNTHLSADTIRNSADFKAGMAFLSWTISIVSTVALTGNNQLIAQALTKNFTDATGVYSAKAYDAPGTVYQMKARLAETKRQDEANKQQSAGNFKGNVENLVREACNILTSLSRGG